VNKDEKKRVNQLVLDILNQNIGMQKGKKYTKIYDDLDHLFGIWTDAEFDKIQAIIDAQRKMV
jgi:ribosomal protein S24E